MSQEGGKITARQIDEIRAIAEQYDKGIAIDIEGVEKVFDNLYHEGR